jgi:hypothetical protein
MCLSKIALGLAQIFLFAKKTRAAVERMNACTGTQVISHADMIVGLSLRMRKYLSTFFVMFCAGGA